MPRQTINVPSIKDWLPFLDEKQVPTIRVLEGENFLITARGVKSPFGVAQITASGYSFPCETTRRTFQSFKIAGQIYLFTDTAVVLYDKSLNGYYTAYSYARAISSFYKWTHAYVGVYHYFAHKSLGCMRFSPQDNLWEFVSADVIGVAAGKSRLIGITKTAFLWSAIDNGLDFVPSLTTGAGAQSLSILGVDGEIDILGVESAFDGIYTFTSQGVLYSRHQQDSLVFNHIPLTVTTYPLNSHCIINEESLGLVIVTKVGFFLVENGNFNVWQPGMSLHLRNEIISNIFDAEQLKLFWHKSKQLLYMSYSVNGDLEYEKAFVLNLPVDQWGHFDKPHVGFVDINDTIAHLHDKNLFLQTGADVDTEFPVTAGWQIESIYDTDNNVISTIAGSTEYAVKTPLKSRVMIGGLKLLAETAFDRLTILTAIHVDRDKWRPSVFESVKDLNNVAVGSVVDLNNAANYVLIDNYEEAYARINSPLLTSFASETLDGNSEGVGEITELVHRVNTNETHACYSNGFYHAIEFKCVELGDKIDVNILSLGAFLGGKIY